MRRVVTRGFATSKDYKRQYYLKNREALLKRNEDNRRKRREAKKSGKPLMTKVGRPKSKVSGGPTNRKLKTEPVSMDERAIQEEIARHEKQHAEWLNEMEQDAAYLTKVYLDQAQFEDKIPIASSASMIPADQPLVVEDLALAVKELGGRDLVVLDTRLKTTLFDYMMICTGKTTRHMSAISQAVFNLFKERRRYHTQPTIEGLGSPSWVLFDAGWVMLHIFDDATREKYDLEQLWGLRRDLEDDGTSSYPSAGYEEVDIMPPEELGLFNGEDAEVVEVASIVNTNIRKGARAREKQKQKTHQKQ